MSSGQWSCWRALWDRQVRSSLLNNTDPEYLSMFPSDSAEDALEKILAMMDRRFIKVEDEERRKYHDVPNFVPLVISDQLLGPSVASPVTLLGQAPAFNGPACAGVVFELAVFNPGVLSRQIQRTLPDFRRSGFKRRNACERPQRSMRTRVSERLWVQKLAVGTAGRRCRCPPCPRVVSFSLAVLRVTPFAALWEQSLIHAAPE